MDLNNKKVVVTGMGVICSIAENIDEFEMALKNGKSNFVKQDIATKFNRKPIIYSKIFLKPLSNYLRNIFFDKKIKNLLINPKDTSLLKSIIPVFEAWKIANLGKVNPEEIGLVIVNQSNLHKILNKNSKGYRSWIKINNILKHIILKIFNIKGVCEVIDFSNDSGNIGIYRAFQLINSKKIKACLIVSPFNNISLNNLQNQFNYGTMGGYNFSSEPEKTCRPFDFKHDGYIYGEGSCCLVLESLESAKNRNTEIMAEMCEGAVMMNSIKKNYPDEESDIITMEKAIENAGISKEDIMYINTNGSSEPFEDKTEIRAIKRVFSKNLSKIHLNSTKCLTGHCLNSAGLINAVATIIQIKNNFIHPNKNLDNPIDKECCFSNSVFVEKQVNYALSKSSGFNKINSCIVFGKSET
ncbi:MAG: hypothetical protein GY714_15010 [Desulfobacterales bacterium]|nr:hypothetical protein [Desulfobacterales bacterium]